MNNEKSSVIYYDDGTSRSSRGLLTAELRKVFPKNIKVKRIYSEEIILSNEWHKDTILFVMPGGMDLPYCKKLNGKGNKSIRKFVENGGAYLGICAGGYYGSNRIVFEPNTSDEIIENRELNFFQGCAFGSLELAEHYEKENLKSISIARISLEKNKAKNFYIFYCGGPRFEPDENSDYEVISRYLDIPFPNNIAIVKTKVNNGIALLCGVHPEYSGSYFSSSLGFYEDGDNEKYEKQADLLIEEDSNRIEFFITLLKESGLAKYLNS